MQGFTLHYQKKTSRVSSAVLTISYFSFPVTGIKAEANANSEMIVVSDVDLSLLTELDDYRSVQTLKNRRLDLYNLSFK